MAATHFSGPVVSTNGFQAGASSYESIITTKALVAADDGKTFGLNLAGGFTVTLPSVTDGVATAGMTFTFRVETDPTTAYIITEGTSDANIIVGGFSSAELTDAAVAASTTGATNINFVASSSIGGDTVTLTCNGTNWFISNGWTSLQASVTIT